MSEASDVGNATSVGELSAVTDPYNLSLQIGGIFIIIATSFLGMGLSLVFDALKKREHFGGGTEKALNAIEITLKGCGVGVIISTALIHLIGEAYEYFEDAKWSETYEQWPMVFAMGGMFAMSVLEYVQHRIETTACPILDIENPAGKSKVDDDAIADVESQPATIPNPLLKLSAEEGAGHWGRKQWNAILCEGSILIHSILIGFDLGLQPERQWIPLITAISFHQFFEGFAVGQVVLEAKFTVLKKSLMILFYSLTTSIGIAIGIGTYMSETYDGNSEGANITIGVLNSICGGLLLFMGMCIFWVEWFVNNEELHRKGALMPSLGFFGILVGMGIMSIIGIWA